MIRRAMRRPSYRPADIACSQSCTPKSEVRRTPAKHLITEDDAITIGCAGGIARDRSPPLELGRRDTVGARRRDQPRAVGAEPPERDTACSHELCDGPGETRVQSDV